MSIFDYQDPIITRRRLGTSDDPFVPISEALKIDTNGKVVLTEIPNKLTKVQVSGQSVTWIEKTSGIPSSNEYVVDYTNKIVTFNLSRVGLQLQFDYEGTGLSYVPMSMIYTSEENGDVTQTLDDIVSAASEFTHKGSYDNTITYKTYNLVSYVSGTYMALQTTTGHLPTDTAYWKKITGYQWRGTYSTSTTYTIGDTVVNGTGDIIYQSVIDNNTNQSLTDATKWISVLSVKDLVDTLNTTNTNIQNAESSRVTAENNRVSQESARVTAESNRVTAENNRSSAESTRSGNETTRQNNESTRQSQESTRQTNTTNAINNLNNAVTQVVHKGVYNSSTSYVVNNSVSYNGSTYRCIQNSTGNLPTNTTYWTLEAQKGADGTGTVTSITSTNSDITVGGTAQVPDLNVNTGVGANKIPKRDANGNLQNIGNAVTNISTNTTLTIAQSGIINVTTGASNITVTLPDATTAQVVYTIKKADSGVGQVIINTTSSQTIDGASSKTLINQYANITVVSSNGNWLVKVHNDTDKIGILNNLTTTDKTSVVSAVNEVNNKLLDAGVQSVNLGYGTQIVTAQEDSPFNVSNIQGRTLVNLLGRDGNFETGSTIGNGWSSTYGGETYSFDTSITKFGGKSQKIVPSDTAGRSLRKSLSLSAGYYVFGIWVYSTAGTRVISFNGVGSSASSNSGKWELLWFRINLASPVTDYFYISMSVSTSAFYVDGAFGYQVSQAEYNALASMTADQVAAKYPYVDDMKPVSNPYAIRYGDNMFPALTEWATSGTAYTVNEPYTVYINGAAYLKYTLNIVQNQSYTVSAFVESASLVGQAKIRIFDEGVTTLIAETAAISGTTTSTQQTVTFNSGTYSIISVLLQVAGYTSGSATFKNAVFNIGTTTKTFVPNNDDMLVAQTTLCSSVDGSVYDSLYTDDNGQLRKISRIKAMDLDGSLTYTFGNDYTGFKRVYVDNAQIPNFSTSVDASAVKYDGKPLVYATNDDAADKIFKYAGGLYISIADVDSGWGESYTPSAAEIQAYFNGWRMYLYLDANLVPYNGTGTKAWVMIDPSAAGGYKGGTGTTTLPTTTNTGTAWTPYKLQYQLATAQDLPVTTEGAIMLSEGANQIEVGVGMIVREAVNPAYASGDGRYFINNTSLTGGNTKYRVQKFLSAYKNTVKDILWQDGGTSTNGRILLYSAANIDTTAPYTFTYLALDIYSLSANPVTMSAQVQANLASTVKANTQAIADNTLRISVVENNFARKQQGQWIAPTLLNGAADNGGLGYYKDEFGNVQVSLELSNISGNPIIMNFPKGYRPSKSLSRVGLGVNNQEILNCVVGSGGALTIYNKTNSVVSLGFSFRADQ